MNYIKFISRFISVLLVCCVFFFTSHIPAEADTTPKLSGVITWEYTRSEKSFGPTRTVNYEFSGSTSANLIFKNNVWTDDGTSAYTGTAAIKSVEGSDSDTCTLLIAASAQNQLWHETRDQLIAQGVSSNWQYGFNSANVYPVQFLVNPSYAPATKVYTASGTATCPTNDNTNTSLFIFPPLSIGGFNQSSGGFIGKPFDSGISIPGVDFNRTVSFTRSDGLLHEELHVTGVVLPKPVATFTSSEDESGFNFDASESQPVGNITTYTWDFGDGSVPLITHTPTIVHNFVDADHDYNVTLTVTDTYGNVSEPFSVIIHTKKTNPTAKFNYVVNSGGKIDFDARESIPYSQDAPIVEYQWNFDDDGVSYKTQNSLTDHTYNYFDNQKPIKKYVVSLVVKDSKGKLSEPVRHEIDVCSPDLPPINGHEYSGLVRCVENAFPELSPRQNLSMLRKIYYGSESWSMVHTEGWDQIIPCGMTVPDPNERLSGKLYDALKKASQKNQIFEGDISHVFTGLEAITCPSSSVTFTPSVPGLPGSYWEVLMPNYYIATWGGDIGSAAGLKSSDDLSGAAFGWPHYIGEDGIRAGYDDLKGDIDGLVLAYMISGSTCQVATPSLSFSQPISQYLRDYYPDTANLLNVPTAYKNRFKCFADILNVKANKQNINVSQLSHRYDTMVYEFALPYYYRVTNPGTFGIVPDKTIKKNSVAALEEFGNWLNSQN